MHHAHENDVVHGDFKPGNVFLTREEDVKIVDFGASAALSGDSSRIPAGTPAYASPQVLGGETPDRRDDIFSFACVAYELLTGQHPFQHRSSLEARDAGATPTRAWNLTAPQWLGLLSALVVGSRAAPGRHHDAARFVAERGGTDRRRAADPADRQRSRDRAVAGAHSGAAWLGILRVHRLRDRDDLHRRATPGRTGRAARRRNVYRGGAARGIDTTSTALPPLSSSVAGSVERPRDALSSMSANESFAADTTLASTNPALLSPAIARALDRTSAAQARAGFVERDLLRLTVDRHHRKLRGGRVPDQALAAAARPRTRAMERDSGTADAGIDFASNASGSVEFADGQAQRAIYVPLRNDLLKEEDETFTVEAAVAVERATGQAASAEATIRDDD